MSLRGARTDGKGAGAWVRSEQGRKCWQGSLQRGGPGLRARLPQEPLLLVPGPSLDTQGSLGYQTSFNSSAFLLLDFSNPGPTRRVGFQGSYSLEY